MTIKIWQKDWKGNRGREMREDKACHTNRLLNEEGIRMKNIQKIHKVSRVEERKQTIIIYLMRKK